MLKYELFEGRWSSLKDRLSCFCTSHASFRSSVLVRAAKISLSLSLSLSLLPLKNSQERLNFSCGALVFDCITVEAWPPECMWKVTYGSHFHWFLYTQLMDCWYHSVECSTARAVQRRGLWKKTHSWTHVGSSKKPRQEPTFACLWWALYLLQLILNP
jgi:hypothetical protein